MLRLVWAAAPRVPGAIADGELERRPHDYIEVLFQWNDRLNTNLSLTGSYFGDDARAYLEGLYQDFQRVGQEVEDLLRVERANEETGPVGRQVVGEFEGRHAGSLNDRVYQFGLMLMGQLREGRVGGKAPNPSVALPVGRAISRATATT